MAKTLEKLNGKIPAFNTILLLAFIGLVGWMQNRALTKLDVLVKDVAKLQGQVEALQAHDHAHTSP